MRDCLKFASLACLLFLAACSNPYKHLQPAQASSSAMRYQPHLTKELYRCVVDGRVLFKKFHLSGLLLFKTFEDGSTRVVFQNEMGFSFFDFKWDKEDHFEVVSIIPQLDKPALVKTLQKDMNLLLMKNLDVKTEQTYRQGKALFQRFTLEKGYAYYISDSNQLVRIENAGKSKVITITFSGKHSDAAMPEALLFRHHKAHFTIQLKQIVPDAE